MYIQSTTVLQTNVLSVNSALFDTQQQIEELFFIRRWPVLRVEVRQYSQVDNQSSILTVLTWFFLLVLEHVTWLISDGYFLRIKFRDTMHLFLILKWSHHLLSALWHLYLRWLRSCLPLECTAGRVSPRRYGVLKEHLIREIRGKGGWVAQRHLSSYDIPFLRLFISARLLNITDGGCNKVLLGIFFIIFY